MTLPRILVIVLPLVVLGVALGVPPGLAERSPNPCVGTITEPPNGTTLLTIQGARFKDGQSLKTPGLLVSVAPNGAIIGVQNNTANGRWWTYDVDPLPNGNLLLVTTEPGISVVEEIDPSTGDHVSEFRLRNVKDAHDVDYIGNNEYVLVDKGEHRDRVLVYDRSVGEIVWEWRFDNHYPKHGGGPYPDDWTHVNDVDAVDEDRFLVSVRNFDQVIIVNRTTKAIETRLGRDDAHSILYEQHNPHYLTGETGPAILVADSRNDRVIEYTREDEQWVATWELVGGGLNEPRDADRLPNGNTLIVDRHGHRTLEVTPDGTVVWEFYSPWQPYDAERYHLGDEPDGPPMRDIGVDGRVELTGSTRFSPMELEACSAALNSFPGNGALVPRDEYAAYPADAGPTRAPGRQGATPSVVTDLSRPTLAGIALGIIVALFAAVYFRRG